MFTLDVITPIVDDPTLFGQIAAANALSDVYAMGGVPQVALSFVGCPDSVGLEVLARIVEGAAHKAREAGCAIVGGHTMKDTEPKCGLAVIGSVGAVPWTHRGAVAGQALVLTKAIGTGVIAQGIREDVAPEESVRAAVASMLALNARGRDVGLAQGATAATDVTGFGLLGHLHHVAAASRVTAVVHASRVPLLPGARDLAARGVVPGGSKRNQEYVGPHVTGAAADEVTALLLADAQTSGGLLLALPADRAEAAVRDLGAPAAIIGELVAGVAGALVIEP